MQALTSWQALLDALPNLNEKELKKLLEAEKSGERRPTFLLRIYGRFSTLRMKRERLELFHDQAKNSKGDVSGNREPETAPTGG